MFNFHCPRLCARNQAFLWLAVPRTNVLKASPFYRISTAVNKIAGHCDVFTDSFKSFVALVATIDHQLTHV